jgi:hypothetical protein
MEFESKKLFGLGEAERGAKMFLDASSIPRVGSGPYEPTTIVRVVGSH